ncbi:MAG TPA: fimbria/pilus periplasmic chaperone, partial [Gemmatimonadaceae bacterium]|nr:fimbria/pilus periplasmic chaperone [Gemmatimonadaceae bacterium]
DPLEVTLVTAGNGRVSASFSMANSTDKPVQATITRQDWDRQENGDNRFLPTGTSGNSCGAMLTASPLSIRIEPRTTRIIRLGVENAGALSKECWDIFFVEEVPQRAAVRGNSLQYIFRTGVKVYVTPPGLKRDGAVEGMDVEDVAVRAAASSTTAAIKTVAASPTTKKQISIRFHNTGGAHLLAKGRLEFRRLDNSLAMQVPIPEFPTLPGATRKVMVDVPSGLAAGDYVVLALIDFGGAEIVAGQIDFQAK